MRTFFKFFVNNKINLYFVFLLFIGFFLLFRSNSIQGIVLNNLFLNFNGWISKGSSKITKYLVLNKENEALLKNNNLLIKENYLLKNNISNTPVLGGDYNFSIAKINYVDYDKKNNYLIINKGEQDDLKLNNVITSIDYQVIGKIIKTSNHFSLVKTVFSQNYAFDGRLKDGTIGLVFWNGKKMDELTMKNIPNYVDVKIGDTIKTNGYSGFPADLIVGYCIKKYVDKSNNNTVIDIKTASVYSKSYQVAIIQNNKTIEIDTLLNSIKDTIDKK